MKLHTTRLNQTILFLALSSAFFLIYLSYSNSAKAAYCADTCPAEQWDGGCQTVGTISNWCDNDGDGVNDDCGVCTRSNPECRDPQCEGEPCVSNGNVSCGSCSVSCGGGTQTCSDNCGSWSSSCNTQPCCTDQHPRRFNLVSPTNNQDVESITPSLLWSDFLTDTDKNHAGWGVVCNASNRNNRYMVYVTKSPTGGAGCPAADRTNSAVWENVYIGTDRNYTLSEAQERLWNQHYCWFVFAHNGVLGRYSEQTWSFFTKIPAPYFSTYGADAYISSGLPSSIETAPNQSEFSIGLTSSTSRLGVIRNELNGTTPYFSTNLFLTATSTLRSRSSKYNLGVTNFTDSNFNQYTIPASYSSTSLTHSFYEYYRQRITTAFEFKDLQTSKAFTSPNGKAYPVNGIYSVRSALGISTDPKNKTIVGISITNGDNLLWPLITNINPQTGWPGYDRDDIIDLSTSNDWGGVGATPEALTCDGQSMFFIDGDLTISADIINATPDSSCVFFIKGHLNIQLPDKRTTHNDYRRIDGLFIANSLSVRGKDDQGAVIINGAVITHNSGASIDPNYFANNKHDIITYTPFRPQTFYVYDPRHITIWKNELAGELDSPPIREQRYLDLIKQYETE